LRRLRGLRLPRPFLVGRALRRLGSGGRLALPLLRPLLPRSLTPRPPPWLEEVAHVMPGFVPAAVVQADIGECAIGDLEQGRVRETVLVVEHTGLEPITGAS